MVVSMCISIALLLDGGTPIFGSGWGSDETNIHGDKKQAINFYGVLTTQQDKQYTVDNIAIGRETKHIRMYEMPDMEHTHPEKKSDDDTNNEVIIMLEQDPKDGIVTKIDLSEVAEITVPHPDTVFRYQKRTGSRKVDYIEVVVVSNDTVKTKNSYLLDLGRKLTCDQRNEAGPIEQEVPFKAIESLVIKGYSYRDERKEKKDKKSKKETIHSSAQN